MSEVYITGHRNPDMDSVCAAYAYANLKNTIDRVNNYNPVRCGHLSDSVKRQFQILGITPPPYMKDVHPKVGDVMRVQEDKIDCNAPIYQLIKIYRDKRPSALPIFDNGKFYGLLSIDDITTWFLKDNTDKAPLYSIRVDNFQEVFHGKMIKKGQPESFEATVLAGNLPIDILQKKLDENPNVILVINYSKERIECAIKAQVPVILIAELDPDKEEVDVDLSSFNGTVYISHKDMAVTLRRLRMTAPVSSVIGPQGPSVQVTDLFDEAKEILTSSEYRGLPVFDGEEYVGFITRRCFLKKPKYNVILVDHNEPNQSIRGIETADVREIIDHHRLDAPKTDLPIFIDSEPLGSTCTIIYQLFVRNNIFPDKITSKVLLAGIIADTIMLRSPTTTGIDIWSAERLAPMAGVADMKAFGQSLFASVGSLSEQDPETVISSDFKTYKEGNVSIGIGQCEVPTLQDYKEYSDIYLAAMDRVKTINHLDWVLLMVTDVLKGKSILFSTNHKLEKKFTYEELDEHIYDMQDALSRKKQLLPEVIHIINM